MVPGTEDPHLEEDSRCGDSYSDPERSSSGDVTLHLEGEIFLDYRISNHNV